MNQSARLKTIIDELKMTQSSFAESIHISKGQVSNILKGDRAISNTLALAIAAVYPNINPDWLLTGKGEKFTMKTVKPVSEPKTERKTYQPINAITDYVEVDGKMTLRDITAFYIQDLHDNLEAYEDKQRLYRIVCMLRDRRSFLDEVEVFLKDYFE